MAAAQPKNKQGKMIGYMNYRIRATLRDGSSIVGTMLAFDKHMNLVLDEAEEFRSKKRKRKNGEKLADYMEIVEKEEKRSLGLTIIRGREIIACTVDGPPPADPAARLASGKPNGGIPSAVAGPGISRPAGRGTGLQGPAAGIGGPGFPGAPQFPSFPGAPAGFPPGFAGRGGPPAFPPQGFAPPGMPPQGFAPPGFQPPNGRGFPPSFPPPR